MTRPHDGEVPVIDRCDFGQPETLSDVFQFRDHEAIPVGWPKEDHFSLYSYP